MLTSKPPFQSSTTDEIYRRARNRDYEWPTSETSNKYISQEAKELVATMLQDADQRPDPDDIVQHDFFVSGHVPLQEEMTSKLRDCPPDADQFYAVDLTPQMVSQNSRNLKELCKACEVGPWSQNRRVCKSTWREVALEEKAGLTPAIPLAEGVVYRPFEEVSKEQSLLQGTLLPAAHSASQKSEQTQSQQPAASTGLLRAPPQSFAAQQRAQGKPARPAATTRSRTADELGAPCASGTLRSRTKRELPQTSTAADVASKLVSRPAIKPTRPIEKAATVQPIVTQPSPPKPNGEPKSAAFEKPRDAHARSQSLTEAPTSSLFSSTERKMAVPDSKPDIILERLRRLQAELERSLNSKSMATVSSRTQTPAPPHIVVKWVDYSNKFGLGYILNDGSIGCVLRSILGSGRGGKSVSLPPSCILVRDAERHCSRKEDRQYEDRHQIVPMSQSVQFYENNGESGVTTVFVHPNQFKIDKNASCHVVSGKTQATRARF